MPTSPGSEEGGGGSREPRRDRSFVVYVWSKGTHSRACIHSFVYFLRREGGGFPSRMLTRWVSVKDDQKDGWGVKQSEFLMDLVNGFAYKAGGCRVFKES